MNHATLLEHRRRIERLASVLDLRIDFEENELRSVRIRGEKRATRRYALVVTFQPRGCQPYTVLDAKDSEVANAFGEALEMVARARRA